MKKKLLPIITVLTLVSIILAACASAGNDATYQKSITNEGFYMEDSADMEMLAEAPSMSARSDTNTYGNTDGNPIGTSVQTDRMIIKNANMTIVVEDPKSALNQVATLAESQGGFIVSSNVSEHETYEGKIYYSADIYVRVPADKFDSTLNDIQEIAYSIDYQSVTGQDVTSEYVDLESELRSLELAEEQLTKIMDEAWDTQDVLNVFRELQNIQSQIEVIKGRMKYLKESSTYSSISVNFQAKTTVEPITIGKWSPKGIAADALQALVNFGKGLINFLIWFLIFALPILVLIALVIWFLVWMIKKLFKRTKKNSKKAEKEQE